MAKHRAGTPDLVHLQAPKTEETAWTNVFCPAEGRFTTIVMARSADGLETYACAACYAPEPVLADVTNAELDAIAEQLGFNE